MKKLKQFLTITIIYLFFGRDIAYAYLDPGTGSYILQILLATILGGAYIFKGYLGKAKDSALSLFTKIFGGKKDDKKKK